MTAMVIMMMMMVSVEMRMMMMRGMSEGERQVKRMRMRKGGEAFRRVWMMAMGVREGLMSRKMSNREWLQRRRKMCERERSKGDGITRSRRVTVRVCERE